MKLGICVVISFIILVSTSAVSDSSAKWLPISEPDELYEVISGKTFSIRKSIIAYYRDDGVMIEHDTDYELPLVRKWKVNDSGQLCWYIFSEQEQLVDYAIFHRNPADPNKLRITRPNYSGANYMFEQVSETPSYLVEALNEKAGPLQ